MQRRISIGLFDDTIARLLKGGAMSLGAVELSILLPAFAAGVLVTATHVPLGMQVLARGIVFIDLAIAQVAGCGVVARRSAGFRGRRGRRTDRRARRGAGRRAASHVDRADLARRAGSGDRRRVRARRDGERSAAREQRPRQRAPARPSRRSDSVGAADAARLGGNRLRGHPRAVVRCARAAWAAPASTCCSRSP